VFAVVVVVIVVYSDICFYFVCVTVSIWLLALFYQFS